MHMPAALCTNWQSQLLSWYGFRCKQYDSRHKAKAKACIGDALTPALNMRLRSCISQVVHKLLCQQRLDQADCSHRQ
jgi:hypothetical protein